MEEDLGVKQVLGDCMSGGRLVGGGRSSDGGGLGHQGFFCCGTVRWWRRRDCETPGVVGSWVICKYNYSCNYTHTKGNGGRFKEWYIC